MLLVSAKPGHGQDLLNQTTTLENSAGEIQSANDESSSKGFEYEPLRIRRSIFDSDNFGMADSERTDFAQQLAALAIDHLHEAGTAAEHLEIARRFLALALQFNPREKSAVVANFRLEKGALPNRIDTKYSKEVFAGLARQVAIRIKQTPHSENILAAGALLNVAVELYPESEDNVFYRELHEIDHGAFDWTPLFRQAVIQRD